MPIPPCKARWLAASRSIAPAALAGLIRRKRISSVLLAMPSSSRRQRQEVLKSLESLPAHVRTVPDISDIVAGRAAVADLQEVDANDLLGRDPVAPNEALLGACIRGKVVLVTGAGGSIGSELCRQILRLAPRRLVLLEISEPALYQIERELQLLRRNARQRGRDRAAARRRAPAAAACARSCRPYGVQTVYHAAAYKHVPIVEHNLIEGIQNNVFGSWYAAEAALECGVETFVLISTRQGGQADQRHGRDQAPRRADAAGAAGALRAVARASAWCASATCSSPRAPSCRCSVSRSSAADR